MIMSNGRGPRLLAGATPTVPVSGLSIYDPIHLGIDENAHRVALTLMYKNLLVGGEPGSGKSSLVNTIVGHAAMSPDCRMWLFDGKLVELDPWRDVADVFVGNDMTRALLKLRELQYELDIRYAMLRKAGRRKIVRDDGLDAILFVIDELALYSATYGTKEEREEFVRILRDIVARGRAAGSSPSPRLNGPRPTSSRPACETCSPTGSRSVAPPTPALTLSCRSAGHSKDSPPSGSTRNRPASVSCSPKAAFPDGSKPPT